MKNKIVILITSIILLSCDGMLDDIRPFNTVEASTALTTSKDVEGLIVGAYAFLGDGDLYGGNLLRDAELIADATGTPASEMFWDGTFVDPGEIWIKNILITNGQVENTYLDAYRVINICNTVLDNLDLVSADKVDRVEGEAKFIRGVVYFELVRVFARTWTDPNGTPATNPGVPLILTPTVTGEVGRSSVALVYQQVIQDLTDAKNLLLETNSFFATTYSASAMLSRVYLMQNNYALAAAEANIVINSGEFDLLPDYGDNFNNSARTFDSRDDNENATIEDVFSVQVTNQAGINNMNTFFSTAPGGRGDIYVEPAHFALYSAGDERLALFYDGERTGKWENQFGNVNIVRLAEMYLTRGEANFRTTGNATDNANPLIDDEPIDDINKIRVRAGLTALTTVTLNDFLSERHKELAFEGHFIHDLKRTQRPVGALPFNSPKLIYPIPNREILINTDMQQNDGY